MELKLKVLAKIINSLKKASRISFPNIQHLHVDEFLILCCNLLMKTNQSFYAINM